MKKLRIVCYNPKNTTSLFTDRALLTEEFGRLKADIVMFPEFMFGFKSIASRAKAIRSVVQETGCNVLVTPRFLGPWKQIKQAFQKQDVEIEENGHLSDNTSQCVGIWFDKNGRVYVFPKSWHVHPLHKIPGTDIAVTICAEINYIAYSPNIKLHGISVLLNPTDHNNMFFLLARTLEKAGMLDIATINEWVGRNAKRFLENGNAMQKPDNGAIAIELIKTGIIMPMQTEILAKVLGFMFEWDGWNQTAIPRYLDYRVNPEAAQSQLYSNHLDLEEKLENAGVLTIRLTARLHRHS